MFEPGLRALELGDGFLEEIDDSRSFSYRRRCPKRDTMVVAGSVVAC